MTLTALVQRIGCAALCLTLALAPLKAQQAPPAQGQPADQRRPAEARPPGEGLPRLPPDATTRHKLDLPGRSLDFSSTAGTIRLFDAASGAPQADMAFIAYAKEGAQIRDRPVTFVFNGGPGYASGWLHLGALGPWRLNMGGEAARPSAPPALEPNAETWLDFTDLVFLDPAGTGCEFAIALDDAWHGSGLAGILMHHLMGKLRIKRTQKKYHFLCLGCQIIYNFV